MIYRRLIVDFFGNQLGSGIAQAISELRKGEWVAKISERVVQLLPLPGPNTSLFYTCNLHGVMFLFSQTQISLGSGIAQAISELRKDEWEAKISERVSLSDQ